MVGLGAQDSLGEAKDFVKDYGVTFQMLWDSSFRSWRELGITGQPAAVLLAPDGSLLKRWTGVFPDAEVAALAARY